MHRKLDNWLDSYMDYVLPGVESAKLFHKWVGLFALSSVLRRKCKLNWGRDLTFYPNIFVLLVGRSGIRKSTAINVTASMLTKVGIPHHKGDITFPALVKQLGTITDHSINDPMYEIMQQQPAQYKKPIDLTVNSSFSLIAPEAVVMLRPADRTFMNGLCDFYDCVDPWESKTKISGSFKIDGVCLSLLGGCTPGHIPDIFPSQTVNLGLASRFIFVYGSSIYKRIPNPFIVDTEQRRTLFKNLVHDLTIISTYSGEFKITENFLHTYVSWYEQLEMLIDPMLNRHFDGYAERLPALTFKLSMLHSAARSGDMTLRKVDFLRTQQLMRLTEADMPLVFGHKGLNPLKDITQHILFFIRNYKQPIVPIKVIQSEFLNDLGYEDLISVLTTLAKAGKIALPSKGENHIRCLNK